MQLGYGGEVYGSTAAPSRQDPHLEAAALLNTDARGHLDVARAGRLDLEIASGNATALRGATVRVILFPLTAWDVPHCEAGAAGRTGTVAAAAVTECE